MHPRLQSIGFLSATLLALYSPLVPFFGLAIASAQSSPLAQSRSPEAEKLIKQGDELLNANKPAAALPLLQQALSLYRQTKDRAGEGQTLKKIGNAHYLLQDYAKAIEYQQQALAIARELRDQELEASALNNLGIAYRDSGNVSKGIEFFEQSLAIARTAKKAKIELLALNNLARTYTTLSNAAKVVEYGQSALRLAREAKQPETEGVLLVLIGSAYSDLKDYPKAIDMSQQALTLGRQIQNFLVELYALDTLTRTYSSLENPPKTVEFATQAVLLARKASNSVAEARALAFLGDAYATLGENQKAIEAAQQVLPLAKAQNNSVLELLALDTLYRAYSSLRDLQKTTEYVQQAIALAEKINNRWFISRAYAFWGEVYIQQSNYQKAIEVGQKSLAIAREAQNLAAAGLALDVLYRSYASLNNYQKTVEFAEQAVALNQQTNNKFLTTRAQVFLAYSHLSLKEDKQAIEYAQAALKNAHDLKNIDIELLATAILSKTYANLQNSPKAIEYAQQTLKLAKDSQNNQMQLQTFAILADVYESIDDYNAITKLIQDSLAIAQRSQNRIFESALFNAQARVYDRLGDYHKAVDSMQKSLEISRSLGNRTMEAQTMIKLGDIYDSLGEHQKGLEAAQQGLKLAQELGDRSLESSAYAQLADSYSSLNEYQKSIEAAEKSLKISQEISNPEAGISAFITLAVVYMQLGDYEQFIKTAQQGITTAQQIKQHPIFEAVSLLFLSVYQFAKGDYAKTLQASQQVLEISEKVKLTHWKLQLKSVGLLLSGMGYGGLKNYDKGIQLAQASLQTIRENQLNSEESALNVLGSLYRKAGQRQKAIAAYQESLAIYARTGATADTFFVYSGLARTYRDLGLPLTAIAYYKQAINRAEVVRKNLQGLSTQLQKSFLQAIQDFDGLKTADTYRELADLLLSQGRILEAQQALELLKVQEIRDFTRQGKKDSHNTGVAVNQTEAAILKEHGTLIAFGQKVDQCKQTRCAQLSQFNDQLESLTEQYNQTIRTVEKEIRQRRAQDEAFLDPSKLAKLKEIVESQPGTLLIYPFVLEDKIWLVWAAKGGVVQSIQVPVTEKQLGAAVLKFRQSLQRNMPVKETQAAGKQLYDWLIKPLEPELKASKIQNLVFSLDRVTRYVPMGALFDGEKYLIENYTVSTVLSADLTKLGDRLAPGIQNTKVLAVGASVFNDKDLNPLPNVPKELDAIVRKQPSDTSGVYPGLQFLNQSFDFRALRDNLLGHRILHIATHGAFVPGRPEDSFLVLGTGEKLTIPKIQTLQDLSNVHLVVLSACETALGGPDQDGVEISGISSYFLNAGAAAVMASLWSVDDASTSQLMQQFYAQLAKGTAQSPITKAEALRRAQLSLLYGKEVSVGADGRGIGVVGTANKPGDTRSQTTFAHPFYWAPFVLIGNGL